MWVLRMLDRYVRCQRVWFLSHSDLKLGMFCTMVWNWVWFLVETFFPHQHRGIWQPFSNAYANGSRCSHSWETEIIGSLDQTPVQVWYMVSTFGSGLRQGRQNRIFWSEIG